MLKHAFQGMPQESLRALIDDRFLIYALAIAGNCVIFALMYLGLRLQKSKLRGLLGTAWGDREQTGRDVLLGAAFSVVLLAVSFLFLVMFGAPSHTPDVLKPRTGAELVLLLIVMVATGVVEELIFRGYLTLQLSHYLRDQNLVVILQAVVFAALHGPGQSLGAVMGRFVGGAFLGLLALQRKSLLPGMVAHCCLDSMAAVALMLF